MLSNFLNEHLVVLPVILPLAFAILLLFIRQTGIQTTRWVSLVGLLVSLVASGFLWTSLEQIQVYELGAWQAPFGIVLVADKLAVLMLLLTGILALGAWAYSAITSEDAIGEHFHPLLQVLLFGLNGAFLTGDLFNLFVFFEVLLLASYVLLLHGGGALRTKSGIHYVALNMLGATLFLFAVGALYGVLGTLNIADLAVKIQDLPSENTSLVAVAGLLLLVVFGIKAAIFPLYLWLPRAYAATSISAAIIFAIMTKLGIYAIIRVFSILFAPQAGGLAGLHLPWLVILGTITLVLAGVGVVASRDLRLAVAYLILSSVATLMIAFGLGSFSGNSAGVYYLIHSTLIGAGMFLLAGLIQQEKQVSKNAGVGVVSGILFVIGALAISGLPPLSGFLGKVIILQAALETSYGLAILLAVLFSSLLIVIALVRLGVRLYFNYEFSNNWFTAKKSLALLVGVFLSSSIFLTIFADSFMQLAEVIAVDLANPQAYIQAVLR